MMVSIRQSAVSLCFLWGAVPALAALSPDVQVFERSRDALLFEPLLKSEELSCADVQRIQSLAEISYPNPHFNARLKALQLLQRCPVENTSALPVAGSMQEITRALAKAPMHMNHFKTGQWVCRWFDKNSVISRPGTEWEWVDVVRKNAATEVFPRCLPSEWRWLWRDLSHYHQRHYQTFERSLLKHQRLWRREDLPDLRRWAWNRLILSAKRRGDRRQVLRYYRQWRAALDPSVLAATPGDEERFEVDMWLVRWESMLGQTARLKSIVEPYKKFCQKPTPGRHVMCREFMTTWLSRLWFENKDGSTEWLAKYRGNSHILWWQAQRAIARKQWNRANHWLEELKRTGSAEYRRRIGFWQTVVAARKAPTRAEATWHEYLKTEAGDDFYTTLARHYAGEQRNDLPLTATTVQAPATPAVIPPPISTAALISLQPSKPAAMSCAPILRPLWEKLEREGGAFLVKDDVAWAAQRLAEHPTPECLAEYEKSMAQHVFKYCAADVFLTTGKIPFREAFAKAAVKYRVPQQLLVGLSRQESAFCPSASSWADALGLMQLQWTPRFKKAGLIKSADELFDPHLNLQAGAWELKRLHDRFHHNWFLALAAYNAGEDLVTLWRRQRPASSTLQFLELIPFSETRQYVRRVFANWMRYEQQDQVTGALSLASLPLLAQP